MSIEADATQLLALDASMWVKIRAFNAAPSGALGDEVMAAREALADACEAFRRRHRTRDREVYVGILDIIAVSPTGRLSPVISREAHQVWVRALLDNLSEVDLWLRSRP